MKSDEIDYEGSCKAKINPFLILEILKDTQCQRSQSQGYKLLHTIDEFKSEISFPVSFPRRGDRQTVNVAFGCHW
jgi:hypothetical protein